MSRSIQATVSVALAAAVFAPIGNADPVASGVKANQGFTYIVQPKFDNAGSFSEGLAAVKVGDKWGFIDKAGKMVIEPQFNPGQAQFNSRFSDGLAAVNFEAATDPARTVGSATRWGFIDKTGAVAINPQFAGDYYSPPSFSEGLAAIRAELKWGYIDKTGRFAIEPRFDQARWFSEGLAAVRVEGKEGYIDRRGELVIKPSFDAAGAFSGGVASVYVDGKSGIIDRTGNLTIELQEGSAGSFSDGLAQFIVEGAFHLDKTGRAVMDEQIGGGKKPWKYGFVDMKGHVVIPPQFDVTVMNSLGGDFSEGLALVEFGVRSEGESFATGGRFGYIDKTGRVVINPKFENASPFSEGLASVRLGGKDGYIDKTGRMVIAPQFDQADSFSEGIARVAVHGKFGFIRRKADQ
jgi:hypothetical protein